MKSAVKIEYTDNKDLPDYPQNYYMGFPVFLVAFTLIWSGLLGVFEALWADNVGQKAVFSFSTTFVYLVCGLTLVFARSRVFVARGLSLAAFVISLGGLFSIATSNPFAEGLHSFELLFQLTESHTLLMGLLALCALACTFGRRYRQVARWVAMLIAGLAIMMCFLSSWLPTQVLYSDTRIFATILLVLMVGSVITISKRERPIFVFFNKKMALLGVLGTLISVLSWYTLSSVERQSIRSEALRSSAHLAQTLNYTVNEHLHLINRMALRWDSLGDIPPSALRHQELNSYLTDILAIDLLAIMDEHQQIKSFESRGLSKYLWLDEHRQQVDYAALVQRAHQRSAVQIGVVDDKTLVVAPLSTAKLAGWSIIAIYNERQLISQSIPFSLGQIKVRITQGERLLYDEFSPAASSAYISRITMPLFADYAWQISTWYQYKVVPTLVTLVSDLIFLLLLFSTSLLTRYQKIASTLLQRSKELRYTLLYDSLTGLPNVKYLNQALRSACDTAMKNNAMISVLLVNLSGVNLINTSVGEKVGDEAVRKASQRIQEQVGDKGLITRLLGGSFVVVLVGYSSEAVEQLMERIIQQINQPYQFEGGDRSLAVNIGIACSTKRLDEPMDLVREAKLALIHAKQQGRNTWYAYAKDLDEAFQYRLRLRSKLRAAIDTDALALTYQPLVHAQSGQVVAAEALLRWKDPELGYLSPAVFIPLAEAMEMIVPLTDWLLNQVCSDIQTLRTKQTLSFPIQVNISPLDFERDEFVQDVQNKLETYALPGEALAIEITEGILLNDVSAARAKLLELRSLGVKASIDDFGTGYSNLVSLKSLPIDKVKMDQSLVSDIVSNEQDATLVKAIISLAHNLGMQVVAEGVETEAQYWFLKRHFCDVIQGYLFARPMPLSELESWLLGWRNLQSLPQAEHPGQSDRTLLLLDDEENILRALKRLLRQEGYNILLATSPSEAMTLLAENEVHVIVSDQRMPEMSGTEFFSTIKQMYPSTVRMILSGYTDLNSVTEAINHGAIYKFLTKPWDDEELRAEIAQAFRLSQSRFKK